MAENEKKITENADVEKNKNGFAYNDVEAAVNKMMTPNVRRYLDKVGVDMTTALPMFYQNSVNKPDETLEGYAQRCIEVSLALRVQQVCIDSLNANGKDRDVMDVELPKESSEPKKEDTEPKEVKEGEDVFKAGNDAQLEFVKLMLGAPLKIIAGVIEDRNVVVTAKGSVARVSKVSHKEALAIMNRVKEAKAALQAQFEKDGSKFIDIVESKGDDAKVKPVSMEDVQAGQQQGKREGQESEKEGPADTDTIKLKNGKELTYADFKATLKQIAESPKSKALIEKLGLDMDEVAAEMFNKIDPSVHEDAFSCAQASLGYVMARKEMLEAYGVKDVRFAKLKDDVKDKKGIDENRESEPRNDLFANMKDILKFPFEVFKRIATGKTDEELKKEAERLNLKDVHLELTPQTREVLTKRLERYESTLAQAVYDLRRQEEIAAQAPGASKQPLSEVGKKATRQIVDDTHEMGYGEPDGKKITQTIEYDRMTQEEKAEYDAEKAAAEEQKNRDGNEGLDKNDPLSKYSQGR